VLTPPSWKILYGVQVALFRHVGAAAVPPISKPFWTADKLR
jgi:hypothetical protein